MVRTPIGPNSSKPRRTAKHAAWIANLDINRGLSQNHEEVAEFNIEL